MSAAPPGPDRKRKPETIEGESRVIRGPWEDLPKTRRPRESLFKKGPFSRKGAGGAREPLINSWRGLVICLLLLFVAPPLAAFLGHVIMRTLFGAQGF